MWSCCATGSEVSTGRKPDVSDEIFLFWSKVSARLFLSKSAVPGATVAAFAKRSLKGKVSLMYSSEKKSTLKCWALKLLRPKCKWKHVLHLGLDAIFFQFYLWLELSGGELRLVHAFIKICIG